MGIALENELFQKETESINVYIMSFRRDTHKHHEVTRKRGIKRGKKRKLTEQTEKIAIEIYERIYRIESIL